MDDSQDEHAALLHDPQNNHYEATMESNKSKTNATTAVYDENKALSFFETLKLYPAAVGWCLFFSLGIIMCAFDAQLMGNLYATPAFQRDFGRKYHDQYIIPASWQTGLSVGGPAGQVFGALFASFPLERYGRRKTFGVCVMVTACITIIQFTARSLEVLLFGELLGGLVLGTYAVIAPAYASEVCPTELRGVITAYINLAFVTGQLLANIGTKYTSKIDSHWAYSTPFALQWFWPLVILIGLPFSPESPWWLVRHEKIEEAEKVLRRLASATVDVEPTLAKIIETDQLEQKLESGTTYADCFKGSNWRRTRLSVGAYAIQVFSGIYLSGCVPYFFELAGMPTDQAFNMGIGYIGMGFIGTCLSFIALLYFGRRDMYNYGLALLAMLQFIVGILDTAPNYSQRPHLMRTQAYLLMFWNFIYDLSIGPVTFVILCEVSATKLRSKSISIATCVQASAGIIMTFLLPIMINPDHWNLRGKLGFVFGTLASLCLIWSYFCIPETKGRTFEELDIMFERKVPTRAFKNYKVDLDHVREDSSAVDHDAGGGDHALS